MRYRRCKDCPTVVPATRVRCPPCATAYEQQRGSRQQRGYDAAHDRQRNALKPDVEAGLVNCWRCGLPITGPWDLGHDDVDRSVYRGPEHQACNRAVSGRRDG